MQNTYDKTRHIGALSALAAAVLSLVLYVVTWEASLPLFSVNFSPWIKINNLETAPQDSWVVWLHSTTTWRAESTVPHEAWLLRAPCLDSPCGTPPQRAVECGKRGSFCSLFRTVGVLLAVVDSWVRAGSTRLSRGSHQAPAWWYLGSVPHIWFLSPAAHCSSAALQSAKQMEPVWERQNTEDCQLSAVSVTPGHKYQRRTPAQEVCSKRSQETTERR